MEQTKINPYIAVLSGVVAVSFSSIFVKLSDAHPFIIAFYRLFLTFILLLPVLLRGNIRLLFEVKPGDVLLTVASGTFLALHFITWFTSLEYTSVASSVVLVTTQPMWVVLGSYIFFKEKVGVRALIGGAIAMAGSIIVGTSDFEYGGRAVIGDILALTGAIMVSGYFVIGRHLRSRMALPVYTFLVYGSASIILGVVAFAAGKSFYPYPVQEWLLFFGLAFICTVLGHTVFNWALKYVQASVVAVGILGEPVGAIIWAGLLLGEIPTVLQLFSAAVILTGLYIFIRFSNNNTKGRS